MYKCNIQKKWERFLLDNESTGLPRTGVFNQKINALRGTIFTFVLTFPPAYIFRK